MNILQRFVGLFRHELNGRDALIKETMRTRAVLQAETSALALALGDLVHEAHIRKKAREKK